MYCKYSLDFSSASFIVKEIFLFSLLTSRTLTFTFCPSFKTSEGFAIFSSVISFIWTNPSTPGNNSTKAPKFNKFTTLPSKTSPNFKFSPFLVHGSSFISFNIKAILSFFASTSPTKTSTSSPTLTTSSALLTLPQDKSFKWINPVIPPISTNAPALIIFLTIPVLFSPDLIDFHTSFLLFSNISSSIILLDATIFLDLKSNSIILTSNSLPIKSAKFILSLEAKEAGINTLIFP